MRGRENGQRERACDEDAAGELYGRSHSVGQNLESDEAGDDDRRVAQALFSQPAHDVQVAAASSPEQRTRAVGVDGELGV